MNLVIVLDDAFPISDTVINVSYRWFAQGAQDSANAELNITPTASGMNQAVVDDAVSKATAAGVVLAGSDRKILLGGFN